MVARAFDPFFTTKPIGQGTGLGLSMIYGFVKQSDGHVRIYRAAGRGTARCAHLPAPPSAATAAAGDAAAASARPGTRPGETVLLVEDDRTVRDLVLDVLGELGYAALEAPDGPSGLARGALGRRIDLLVTDVGLPGHERPAARRRRRGRCGPTSRCCSSPATPRTPRFGDGHLDPDMQMMTKPFAVDALARRIRSMIGPGRG